MIFPKDEWMTLEDFTFTMRDWYLSHAPCAYLVAFLKWANAHIYYYFHFRMRAFISESILKYARTQTEPFTFKCQ